MTPPTLSPTTERPAPPADGRLTWPRAVALHLAPGVALLVVYLGASPLLRAAGLPPLWGLLLGIALVVVPVELGLVLRALRRRGLPLSPGALGLRRPTRGDVPALALAGVACLVLPGLGVALEPWLAGTLFGWLPDWYGAGLADLSGWAPGVQAVTLVLWSVLAVVLGPVAEELYFRGWLLPRLPGAPVPTSAALFAVYHLWQPQAVLTVFLFALPLTVLVRRRGTVALSVLVHCGVNLVAFAALLAGVLER